MNSRSLCVIHLKKIIYEGASITQVTNKIRGTYLNHRDQARILSTIYGILRNYYSLSSITNLYLRKKLRNKDKDIQCILLCMVYELLHTCTPKYAVISENVQVARNIKKNWATGMINAIGRNILNDNRTSEINVSNETKYNHCNWMIDLIKNDWPDSWEEILNENNLQPPFTIRTIKKNIDHEKYKTILANAGIKFEQCEFAPLGLVIKNKLQARELPLFNNGAFIVQDEAAQLATELVCYTKEKKNILDVCAAPGGKTSALLDSLLTPANLVALDIHHNRLKILEENLKRLNFSCQIKQLDATQRNIFPKNSFDYIMLDAPCSSSGVIRRHPDIKIKKNADNLLTTIELQTKLLTNVWKLLEQNGILLYTTCSVFKKENDDIILRFLETHENAELIPIKTEWGLETKAGRQILPGMSNADGFFFSKIKKSQI